MGTHYQIYQKLGAHLTERDGKEGVYFAVWAPIAHSLADYVLEMGYTHVELMGIAEHASSNMRIREKGSILTGEPRSLTTARMKCGIS